MSKRKIGIAVAVLLLLAGGTVWAFRGRADAAVEKIRQMQKDLASVPPDGRRQRWEDLGKEWQKLTPDQQDKLRDERWAERERMMNKRVKDFFAAPPNQRQGILDKQINDDEKRRKEREARRAQGGGPGGNPAGPNPNGPGPSQAGSGQAANGPNAGRQPGGGRNANPETQSANRNRRLDNSSPEQRAQQAAYNAALQKRRIERGLPAWGGRPGGR
jgi:hypothetical protein